MDYTISEILRALGATIAPFAAIISAVLALAALAPNLPKHFFDL